MKNNHWYQRVVGIVFAVWPLVAYAQQPKELSLTDAVELALKNNRPLQAAVQYSEAVKSIANQAKGGLLPRVDLIEGFNYSDKPTLVFSSLLDQGGFKQKNFAIGSLNAPTPLTNLGSQIRFEQPLYAGGKLLANARQAAAAAAVSEEGAQRTRQEVIAAVIEVYYRVLLTRGNLEAIDKSLASARAHLVRTQDLFEKGLVVRSDVLRAGVLVGSLEREKMEAENMIVVNQTQLKYLLGVDDVDFRLTERAGADVDPLESLDGLVVKARQYRHDLKAAAKEVERASEIIRVVQADYFPTLSFVTQVESNTRKFTNSAENFAVFVTARLNLFNGFATQEKVAEARALLRRAQLLRDDLFHVVAKEVEQMLLALTVARRQVEVARQNLAQAEESRRIVTDRYQAGLARNVDVLDGEAVLKRTEQDLLNAQIGSQIFRARLNLAIGDL
jgi:outer membrane protein